MTSNKQSRSVSAELEREVEVVSDHVFTGEHDTQQGSLFSESEMVEWEFNKKALFETISHKIYESDEAGVREPVFNGVSAALRAAAQGYTDDPRVAVYLFAGDEDRPMTLIIRDNGTGVSEEMLKESMAHVGNSQNRYVANLMGKFGFGFLASFRLVTSTGTFFMHTHARDTGEEYRGAWSNAGFEIDKGGDLPDALDDEYGTRLEFPVKDDISRSQIREWVEENARDARIPVEYHESGFDEPYHNTELGDATLDDAYDNPDSGYCIETDAFVAWCHPEASGRTLCLDGTIRRNATTRPSTYRSNYDNPYRIDIRFTNENGSVFDAEDDDIIGKTPVNDAEYPDIPEELRDKFVKRSALGRDAIETPHPTGSRDSLSDEPAFWSMLGERFAEMHRQTLRNAVDKIEQDAPDALTDAEVNALKTAERYLSGLDDETSTIIDLTQQEVNTVDANGDMNYRNDRYTDKRPTALEVAVEADDPVFMGVNIHDGKRAVVQEEYDGDVTVVKLERGDASDKYEHYNRLFGWRKIKDIDVEDDEFDDVSDETKDRVRRGRSRKVSDSLADRRLKVHYSAYGSGRSTTEVTVGDLQGDDDDENPLDDLRWDVLVLFPSTGDAKVSSHYSLVNECYGVARCTKKVADALCGEENIVLYENLNDVLADMTVPTADGEQLVDSLNDALFLVQNEDFVQEMRDDPDVFDAVAQAFRTNFNHWYESPGWSQDEDDLQDEYDITLVPVTDAELARFRPVLDDMEVETTTNPDALKLRAYADLPRWRDNDQFADLLGTLTSNRNLAGTMMETWRAAHDAGMTLDDVQDD